jgi:hypothetical protein
VACNDPTFDRGRLLVEGCLVATRAKGFSSEKKERGENVIAVVSINFRPHRSVDFFRGSGWHLLEHLNDEGKCENRSLDF